MSSINDALVFLSVEETQSLLGIEEAKRYAPLVQCKHCAGTGSNTFVFPIEGCFHCDGSGVIDVLA